MKKVFMKTMLVFTVVLMISAIAPLPNTNGVWRNTYYYLTSADTVTQHTNGQKHVTNNARNGTITTVSLSGDTANFWVVNRCSSPTAQVNLTCQYGQNKTGRPYAYLTGLTTDSFRCKIVNADSNSNFNAPVILHFEVKNGTSKYTTPD